MNATTTMENFFSECYLQYQGIIRNYIICRINHPYEAEDLVQDVFVRLWEYRAFVNPDTVRQLLFTIARNIIIDKIRIHYKKEEYTSYIYNVQEVTLNTTEEQVQMHELETLHNTAVHALPSKRRHIYELSFYGDMSIQHIAQSLSVSTRTVEGHLFLARRSIRTSLKQQYFKVG